MNINYISKKELEKELNFSLDKPYAVVTYHPVTLENNSEIIQTKEILSACEYFQNYKYYHIDFFFFSFTLQSLIYLVFCTKSHKPD